MIRPPKIFASILLATRSFVPSVANGSRFLVTVLSCAAVRGSALMTVARVSLLITDASLRKSSRTSFARFNLLSCASCVKKSIVGLVALSWVKYQK